MIFNFFKRAAKDAITTASLAVAFEATVEYATKKFSNPSEKQDAHNKTKETHPETTLKPK
ncbi:MAG: hypothetical protein A3E88_03155 [Legionellales bacterium RIFCSPHIGHO2_12_FULL_35_11]|nr:MAG: hypothetical protein A3E88_03155 [Legionellales bacterium RIFCSPHIGHO2_12_FULL_35_11]